MSRADFGAGLADLRANLLFQLVSELKTPFGYERSVRLCQGGILPNRFLLSFTTASLGSRPADRLSQMLRRMNAPDALPPLLERLLPTSPFIHLGFEQNTAACLYKIYFEQALPSGAAARATPILLHLATKWNVDDPRQALSTRYEWRPGLNVAQMIGRMHDVYAGSRNQASFEIARRLLEFSAARTRGGTIRFMEVTEEGNPRRSFDLNLYDARIQLNDLRLILLAIRDRYSIDPEAFDALLESNRSRVFGHLAGGVHRDGQDFFNIYFGVEPRHG